jgi:hypothetical protein
MLPEIHESRRLYPLKTIHICTIRRLDENSLAAAIYKFSKINIQSCNQLVKISSGVRLLSPRRERRLRHEANHGRTTPDCFLRPPDKPQDKQQDDRAYRCSDDRRDHAAADADTEHARQPAADKRPDNPDKDIDQDAKPSAFHQYAGQPAGNCADNQPGNKSVFHIKLLSFESLN